jgi:hypothetical protein
MTPCRPVRRDDAEQQVPGVRDARIREHPLDVRLDDTDDRADDHRDGGDHDSTGNPVRLQRLERRQETRARRPQTPPP